MRNVESIADRYSALHIAISPTLHSVDINVVDWASKLDVGCHGLAAALVRCELVQVGRPLRVCARIAIVAEDLKANSVGQWLLKG